MISITRDRRRKIYMDDLLYKDYLNLLKSELQVALGCTEPIAIAYAVCCARSLLKSEFSHIELECSGNIVKNAMAVKVPNSGGQRGIKVAALLGAIGGVYEKGLACLSDITENDRELCRKYLEEKRCKVHCLCEVAGLKIIAKVYSVDGHEATVEIKDSHTNIVRMELDGKVVNNSTMGDMLFLEVARQELNHKVNTIDELIGASCEGAVISPNQKTSPDIDIDPLELRNKLELKEIIYFAENVNIEDVRDVIMQQANLNMEIAEEGLRKNYGAEVGQTIRDCGNWDDVETKIKALTSAGSDARMSGCSKPVVINSGSGNQGITVSVPVVVYAREKGYSEDEMIRALVCSNLIALLQKRYIGNLSAYCGVMCAATAAACGITFLKNGRYEKIGKVITNTLGNISGVFCDGAKSSCAAKIASGLEAALLSIHMVERSCTFQNGEGLTKDCPEETIRGVGYVAREGMRSTDREILKVMLGEEDA